MGSLFKSSTPAPTLTAMPIALQDQVNGVEQVPVKNADGSYTYVTRALPLTAEQQAEKDKLNSVMKDALAEIQALSANDYTPDAATQKTLDAWQETQTQALDTTMAARARTEEANLAKRGLGDSSVALATRRARALDTQDAESALLNQKDQMASQVRADKLTLQQNLYSLANNELDASAAQTAQAATKVLSSGLAANLQQQSSLLDYYAKSGTKNVFGNSFSNSLGSVLGQTVGGVGSTTGGLLGSWLWRK